MYNLNNYSAALADLNKAISLSPKTVKYYKWRGDIYHHGLNNNRQALSDYQQALKLARTEGDRKLEQKIENTIEDLHTEPQRTAIGMVIAGLCTAGIYAGMVKIARRNERKYLQQLESEVGDGSDRH